MTQYKLLLGMTIPALEAEINQVVSNDSSARLINAFYAPGAGFVGAIEYQGEANTRPADHPLARRKAMPQRLAKAEAANLDFRARIESTPTHFPLGLEDLLSPNRVPAFLRQVLSSLRRASVALFWSSRSAQRAPGCRPLREHALLDF